MAFKMMDVNGTGKIGLKELQKIIGKDESIKLDKKYFEKIIQEVNENGDGTVKYNNYNIKKNYI